MIVTDFPLQWVEECALTNEHDPFFGVYKHEQQDSWNFNSVNVVSLSSLRDYNLLEVHLSFLGIQLVFSTKLMCDYFQ